MKSNKTHFEYYNNISLVMFIITMILGVIGIFAPIILNLPFHIEMFIIIGICMIITIYLGIMTHKYDKLCKLEPSPGIIREPIQVSFGEDEIIALCNDGTIWYKRIGNDNFKWVRQPDIPQ